MTVPPFDESQLKALLQKALDRMKQDPEGTSGDSWPLHSRFIGSISSPTDGWVWGPPVDSYSDFALAMSLGAVLQSDGLSHQHLTGLATTDLTLADGTALVPSKAALWLLVNSSGLPDYSQLNNLCVHGMSETPTAPEKPTPVDQFRQWLSKLDTGIESCLAAGGDGEVNTSKAIILCGHFIHSVQDLLAHQGATEADHDKFPLDAFNPRLAHEQIQATRQTLAFLCGRHSGLPKRLETLEHAHLVPVEGVLPAEEYALTKVIDDFLDYLFSLARRKVYQAWNGTPVPTETLAYVPTSEWAAIIEMVRSVKTLRGLLG